MCEVDKHMHELAAKALAKNPNDWQAYLLLDVSERRLKRERELYGETPTPRTSAPQPLDTKEHLQELEATISELHASSTGETRTWIEKCLRDLANSL